MDARANQPVRRSVSLHGRKVSYLEYQGSGQTMLFMHGVGSSAEVWQPSAERFAAQGVRVVCIDLPGHGESSKEPGDYSLGSLASTVRDLIEHLGLGPVILVGHSLGGGIALQFLYQYPGYVAGLVLVSSGGLGRETNLALRLASVPGSGVVIAAAFNSATMSVVQTTQRAVRRMRRSTAVDEGALERFRWLSMPDYRHTFLATLRSVVDFSGQRVSALEKLHLSRSVPVLIIWGGDDPIIPPDHGRLAHSMLEDSELIIFEGHGHEPHRSDTERFYDSVDTWAQRHALLKPPPDLDDELVHMLDNERNGGA